MSFNTANNYDIWLDKQLKSLGGGGVESLLFLRVLSHLSVCFICYDTVPDNLIKVFRKEKPIAQIKKIESMPSFN